MKKSSYLFWSLLLAMFVSSAAFAQTVSGTVVDEDGTPLIGAAVLIKGTTTGTITDVSGNYSLTAADTDILMISYVGFQTMEVSAAQASSVTLIEDLTTLSDVVVTATRQPVRKIQTTTAISSIDAEELKIVQAESFAEALQNTPGVTVSNSQGRKSSYNIRGFPSGNTYVTSMLDGLPMSGFAARSAGTAEFHGFDTNIERIEVVRGSGATLFGRAAGAGAINVISKMGGTETKGTVSFTKFNNAVSENSVHDGNFDYRVDANINGPITDKLRYNVGGYLFDDAGFKDWAHKDKGAQIRGNLDYLVNDKTSIRVYGMYGNNQFNNLTDSPFNIGTGELDSGWTNVNTYYPNDALLDYDKEGVWSSSVPRPILDSGGNPIIQNQAEDNREEVQGGQFGITATIGLAKGLTFVEKFRIQSFDWMDHNEIAFSSFYARGGSLFRGNFNSTGHITDIVNEARFQYELNTGSSKHNFSLGAYFSNAQYDRFGGIHLYLVDISPSPTYGWFGPPGTQQPTYALSSTTSHQEESILGIFLGDEMVFNEKLSINVGFRYDQMTGFFNNDPDAIQGVDFVRDTLFVENELDFSDFSGSVGVNYLINDRTAVYGSFVRAFSLPSVSSNTVSVPEENEIVLNSEIGFRAGVGDLGIDIALFNTQISNRLATVFDPSATGAQTFVQRPVGTNTVRGTELQLTYAPSAVKGLLVRGSFTFQQSQYQDFQIALGKVDHDSDPATPRVVEADLDNLFGLELVTIDAATNDYAIDVAGNQVQGTPKTILNFSALYRHKYFGVGFDFVNYSGRYASAMNLLEVPDLNILNGNIYGQYPLNNGSKVRLGLRIKNLLDTAGPQTYQLGSVNDNVLIQKQATPDFTDVLGFGVTQMPRRIYLTLGYDF